MAKTDTEDMANIRDPAGFTFIGWLRNTFLGGSQKIIKGGGGVIGAPLPVEAKVAMQRLGDSQKGNPYFSRMEEAKARNAMWDNEIDRLLWPRLKAMFHPENYSRIVLTPSIWTNQLRRVIEDISILYENPAKRSLEDDKKVKQTVDSEAAIDKAADLPEDPKAAPADENDPAAEGEPAPKVKSKKAPPAPAEKPAALSDGEAPVLDTGDPDIDALSDLLELDGGDEAKESNFDKVMKLADLDVTLDRVEKMVRFHDAVWVRPMVHYEKDLLPPEGTELPETEAKGDPTTAKLRYKIYDPSCADIVEDPQDPARAVAFFYWGFEYNAKGEKIVVIWFFTKDQVFKFDEQWKPLADPVENKLGRLPVSVFRKDLPSQGSYYVNGSGRDLFEGTLEACWQRTVQNSRFKESGFKQLAFTGVDEDDVPADQVMGGPTPIYGPDGSSVSVLDLTPDLISFSDMIESRQLELAAKHGISSAEYKAEGAPQSGFAKKLDRDKVLKENRRIRKFFAEAEKDLYNLLAVTLNTHKIDGIDDLEEDAEFCVDFSEPSFEEDPQAQARIDAEEIKLETTNVIEVLKRKNPDLNDVELLKMAAKNKRINKAFLRGDALTLTDLLADSAAGAVGVAKQWTAGKGSGAPAPAPGAPAGKPAPFGGKK
jgi:hypothetical protein